MDAPSHAPPLEVFPPDAGPPQLAPDAGWADVVAAIDRNTAQLAELTSATQAAGVTPAQHRSRDAFGALHGILTNLPMSHPERPELDAFEVSRRLRRLLEEDEKTREAAAAIIVLAIAKTG
jgi:hypothetical protein